MFDPEYAISVQSGYVLVETPPDFNVVWIEQPPMLQAISAACSEADCKKVLLRGSNTKVKLKPMEIFELGAEIAKLHLMLAIVQSHDASKEDEDFLKNVAANRGSSIQFSDNEQDARYWLGV